MTAPLQGLRVLEVASWLAAPSCAALMADMGASVIKVEPPGGDSYRKMYKALLGGDGVHPAYQFDNRGKRGVCVNLETPEGVELVKTLARDVDVFITNLTWDRLERYTLTDGDIHAVAPRAVFAVLSGYGTHGPDSHRQAFDQTAFWARSGAMSIFGDRDEGSLISRGGYGDRTTCLNLLASILAALRLRDQSGEPQYVEVTLQRTGIWALASDVCGALSTRLQPEKTSRNAPPNPIWNSYTTSDGREILLVMPFATPFWPKFCRMAERPEWVSDTRFQDLLGLAEYGPSIVPEIRAMFAKHDLAYWREKLDAAGLIWEPVATLPEVAEDPVLLEADAFSVIVHERAGAMEVVSAPFHIRGADIEVRGPAPDAGQHTREVFAEAGLSAARIDELLAKGVLATE
ncbi:MAG: CoA transferase [Pseudomonadales bacterium]|nr:CoA transferase [Pseudomonadales bacterium]MCP5185171.1 CoA transferase [Pseudomonadales bacterium]